MLRKFKHLAAVLLVLSLIIVSATMPAQATDTIQPSLVIEDIENLGNIGNTGGGTASPQWEYASDGSISITFVDFMLVLQVSLIGKAGTVFKYGFARLYRDNGNTPDLLLLGSWDGLGAQTSSYSFYDNTIRGSYLAHYYFNFNITVMKGATAETIALSTDRIYRSNDYVTI